jgi:hypothetical protein
VCRSEFWLARPIAIAPATVAKDDVRASFDLLYSSSLQRPCFFQKREHPHALDVRSLGIPIYCGCREGFIQIALMRLLAKTYLTTV